jgi:hypothetical protein
MKIEDCVRALTLTAHLFNEVIGTGRCHVGIVHETWCDHLVPEVTIWSAEDFRQIVQCLGIDSEEEITVSGDKRLVAQYGGVRLYCWIEEDEL